EDRLANQYDAEIGRQLALKLATIYEDALGDAASAVDKLRQALDYPGDERGPLAALDRLLETLGRWPELAEILEREAQAGLEPLERARLLERIAELQEKELRGNAAALDAWARALLEDPSELRYADEVARLGEALGMPAEAAGRIEAVADAAEEKSKEAARDLGLRAGAIWLAKARDLARAEARYRRVLELDAENQDALEALDQIARGKGDDTLLTDALSR